MPSRKRQKTFTLVDVQRYTNLSIEEIKKAIRAGHLPARLEGSRYVIGRDGLIKLMVEVTGKTRVRAAYDLDHM
jgi:hypothetical protein